MTTHQEGSNNNTRDNSIDNCCICNICMPYKSGIFIVAHILASVGVIVSWSSFLAGTWLALIGWIVLLCSCCCRTNQCGLITSGVFLALAAVACFVQGMLFFVGSFCKNTDDDYYSYSSSYYGTHNDMCNFMGVFAILASVVLCAASVLIFIFTCTGRWQQAQLDAGAAASQQGTHSTIQPDVAVPATATILEIKAEGKNNNKHHAAGKSRRSGTKKKDVELGEEEEVEEIETARRPSSSKGHKPSSCDK